MRWPLLLFVVAALAWRGILPGAAAEQGVTIPENRDDDLRVFYADGRLVKGAAALQKMASDAELVLWLAGNQYFVMEDLIHRFQQDHPGLDVGVVTLPDGLLFKAIQAGGFSYAGAAYPGKPDVYGTVDLGNLKVLKQAGLADRYLIYAHNELEIMVAKGNPKKIANLEDMLRPGIRTSMPNPVNEGIMKYARPVLERHHLWQALSGGKECIACQSTPSNWFTAVHHRETPERIVTGLSDAGIVWKTETLEAIRTGRAVEGVALPAADSRRDEAIYAAVPLLTAKHSQAASQFVSFVGSPAGTSIYTRFGFVAAGPAEAQLSAIP
ncbi:molybdate ABC transporter substrate-binding protein [Gloeobacter kilaueensis]|uniref:Molybdenum ABC transporter, periplasmic molybdate-binding protein n=1 Tax=Gloeobacter kilaueensis (strain ATCC BAA-2537 / CCAP 1431/1 / ULC 316 / JS1) TaxID=1183438 RepID=U5QJL6_GLOK1|nr:substrate-binding domain-containing protein [Gloeobacter kilaueensis]AGY59187.1 molybdenum ABC transporter, periplasmic molybdate-binding protein [Gloeobacter kilaueensis JS1]